MSWLWTRRECKGQVPAGRHSASIVCHGDRLFLFGGTSTSTAFNDVHVLNTKTWEWAKMECSGPAPSPRWGHRAHIIPGTSTMIVHGGCDVDHGALVSIALLDLETGTWSRPASVSGATPPARAYHATAMLGKSMYVFGGDPAPKDAVVYALDVSEMHWSAVGAPGQQAGPEPRKKPAVFATAGQMWLSAGVETNKLQYLEDLRIFDVATGKWSDAKPSGALPGTRGGHTCEVIDEKVILWGGLASKGVYPNEIYQLNLGSRSWFKRRGSGPAPVGRVHHCSGVTSDKEFLVFGGISSENEKVSLNDVYTLTMGGY